MTPRQSRFKLAIRVIVRLATLMTPWGYRVETPHSETVRRMRAIHALPIPVQVEVEEDE